MSHHAPVRQTGSVNTLGIHRVVHDELVQQRIDEFNIMHLIVHCIATTMPRIPGQEFALEAPGSLGIDNNEALAGGFFGEARHAFGIVGVPPAAMKNQNQRHPPAALSRFTWSTYHIATLYPIMNQGLSLPGSGVIALRGKGSET